MNTVDIATKMVKNLLDHMILKQEKIERYVEFPTVLSQIDTEDANFEMITSNNIQLCKLFHANSRFKPFYLNTINPHHAVGVIVVNTCIKSDKLPNGKQKYDPTLIDVKPSSTIKTMIENTKRMFRNLQIEKEQTKIMTDWPKSEILNYFEKLTQYSE